MRTSESTAAFKRTKPPVSERLSVKSGKVAGGARPSESLRADHAQHEHEKRDRGGIDMDVAGGDAALRRQLCDNLPRGKQMCVHLLFLKMTSPVVAALGFVVSKPLARTEIGACRIALAIAETRGAPAWTVLRRNGRKSACFRGKRNSRGNGERDRRFLRGELKFQLQRLVEKPTEPLPDVNVSLGTTMEPCLMRVSRVRKANASHAMRLFQLLVICGRSEKARAALLFSSGLDKRSKRRLGKENANSRADCSRAVAVTPETFF